MTRLAVRTLLLWCCMLALPAGAEAPDYLSFATDDEANTMEVFYITRQTHVTCIFTFHTHTRTRTHTQTHKLTDINERKKHGA